MADRVGNQGQGRDTRTTTRWSVEELAWLEARAAGGKVGSVVRGIVRRAMAGEEERELEAAIDAAIDVAAGLRPGGRRTPAAVVADRARAGHAAMVAEDEAAAAGRRVPRAAAPSSPSGAAAPPRDLMRDLQASLEPAAVAQRMRGQRVRLEVVVARMLDGGGQGPIPPARLADARRLIKGGRVRVSGRPVSGGALDPGTLVGPGEVEIVRGA